MIEAGDSGVAARRRSARSSSLIAPPAAVSSWTAPLPLSGSITQTCRTLGAPPRSEWASPVRATSTQAALSLVSANTATAPESDRIHSTCSAEEVS